MAKIIREKSGFGAELANFFFRILRGEPIPLKGRTRSHVPTLDQRIAAAQWLADRGWGKAKETIELTGEATTAQRLEILRRLTDEERDQLRTLLARALEPIQESNGPVITVESNVSEVDVPIQPLPPSVGDDEAEKPLEPQF